MADLLDLPRELIEHVLAFLPLAHLSRCVLVSPLLLTTERLEAILAKRLTGQQGLVTVLRKGAPLRLVREIVERGSIRIDVDMSQNAGEGGRPDVIEWIVERAGNAVRSYAVYVALEQAVRCGRVGAVGHLLDTHFTGRNAMMPFGWYTLCREAVQHLDVFVRLHEYGACLPRVACPCSTLNDAIIEHDCVPVLEWIYANCASGASARWEYNRAIASGKRVARVMALRIKAAVARRVLADAVCGGHVRSVALTHSFGLRTFDLHMLREALCYRKLNIVRWAAGERDIPDVHPDDLLDAPLPFWNGTWVACVALRHNFGDAIAWLSKRDDARRWLTVAVARCAVKYGRIDQALLLDGMGFAPFGTWDSLDAAAESGHMPMVKAVEERGAAYRGVSSMLAALRSGSRDVVRHMVGRYGIGDLQEALDRFEGREASMPAIEWVRDNVRSVCTSGAYACQEWRDAAILASTCRCLLCNTGPGTGAAAAPAGTRSGQ
jgi:hypothetical protein